MLLFVGLGNPAPNSQDNRHNIGFKIIDAINQKFNLSKQKPKFKGLLTTGNIGDKKIYAINNSNGNYLWNAGIFIWKANLILSEIKTYMPSLYSSLNSIRNAIGTKTYKTVLDEEWELIQPESIDYGILEKSLISDKPKEPETGFLSSFNI